MQPNLQLIKKKLGKKRLVQAILTSGVLLTNNSAFAYDAVQPVLDKTAPAELTQPAVATEDAEQAEKIKARLAEIDAEEKKAALEKNGYYVERRSYGTGRETEPPRYVKQLNKTWLKDYDSLADIDWLDIGLDYRFRYENRDNDFRRSNQAIDEPFLLRTRGFVAVKNILDPLRFTLEVEDARRNYSQFTRQFDTRDINLAEPIQAYAELYFKDSFLPKDDLNNARPISLKYGRHAFELTDRRLVARNEWRNTTNNFQGLRSHIGQAKNDWEIEAFALQPVQRLNNQLDEKDDSQQFYGIVGDWRGWSQYITLEPYYFLLKQDGDKVELDLNARPAAPNAKIDREIHTAGLRTYGILPNSGWDYDVSVIKQWGKQDRRANNGTFIAELDHEAYAYNGEIGYTFKNAWKPRLSAFYGVATGDENQTDGKNQRFERLFGFARPWSNDDYIQMENISTPKVRAEFDVPQRISEVIGLNSVKVDTGFSRYYLESDTDRWNAGANLRDATGRSGDHIGDEFDLRVRFPLGDKVAVNFGYAHFWAGEFTRKTSRRIAGEQDRDTNSDFFYLEVSASTF
jgi:hypothetical protein